MKPITKTYIAAAAVILLAVTITWLWSNYRIAGLERDADEAKAAAIEKQQTAARLEAEAAEYKQKSDYLEQQLANIRQIARRQDEELTKLNSISNNARRDVDRARRARPAGVTAAELCQKLAELGHPCK
jgi:biopolymer transport protein ExbB/TolQ